jgi:hypothetical protein
VQRGAEEEFEGSFGRYQFVDSLDFGVSFEHRRSTERSSQVLPQVDENGNTKQVNESQRTFNHFENQVPSPSQQILSS